MAPATATEAAEGTPAASPTPAATASPTPVPSVTIAAVGDLMLDRRLISLMEEQRDYPFERVMPLFEGADLLIGNMEGTFTDRGEPLSKYYLFRTPPHLAETLALAGFAAVSLGNNHATDFGTTGLRDTMDALDAVGVAHFGAGVSEAEARAPRLLEANGLTVAFLGYNIAAPTEVRFAGGEAPGVARATEAAIAEDVTAALARADFVVVWVHAGVEYSHQPTEQQRGLARAAVDAGASAVLGHHPHVLQRWERRGDAVVFYSLGNFVFDLDPEDLQVLGRGPFQSVVAMITLRPGEPPEVALRPVRIDEHENRPRPATEAEAAEILALLGDGEP